MGVYENIIQRFYVAFLGRPADTASLRQWDATLVANNGDTKGLISTIAASAEFQSLYAGKTDTEFLNTLYSRILNRAPDTAGLAYWSSVLSSGFGSREYVIQAFMYSPEANASNSVFSMKVTCADYFTDRLFEVGGLTYSGDVAAAVARGMLATVTDAASANSFNSNIVIAANHVHSATQTPGSYQPKINGGTWDATGWNPSSVSSAGDTTSPTITVGPEFASATTISLTSNEAGSAGLYDGSSALVGSAATLVANVSNTITVAAQGAITTTSLVVKDAAANATTSSTKVILGTAGADTVNGTNSSEIIFGFGGDDVLWAGGGADVLVGGAGSNTFRFVLGENGTPSATANYDTVADYRTGTNIISFGNGVLSVGTQVGVAGAGVATVSATGVLSFNGADATLAQHLVAAEAALHAIAGNPTSGATVIWQEGADAYVLASDAVAGVGAGDSLVKLIGVTVAAGGLTIVGGYLNAIA